MKVNCGNTLIGLSVAFIGMTFFAEPVLAMSTADTDNTIKLCSAGTGLVITADAKAKLKTVALDGTLNHTSLSSIFGDFDTDSSKLKAYKMFLGCVSQRLEEVDKQKEGKKEEDGEKEIGGVVAKPEESGKDEKKGQTAINRNEPSKKAFFFEDFSKTPSGQVPSEWIGGASLLVGKSDESRGDNILKTFADGPHQFIIPDINFPEKWVWEVQLINNRACCSPIVFQLGEISVGLTSRGNSWLDKSKFSYNHSSYVGQTVIYAIKKEGDVFRLLINGKEHAIARISGFVNPDSFRFEYKEPDQKAIIIRRIQGKVLP